MVAFRNGWVSFCELHCKNAVLRVVGSPGECFLVNTKLHTFQMRVWFGLVRCFIRVESQVVIHFNQNHSQTHNMFRVLFILFCAPPPPATGPKPYNVASPKQIDSAPTLKVAFDLNDLNFAPSRRFCTLNSHGEPSDGHMNFFKSFFCCSLLPAAKPAGL